ncbi:MAG: hypothetical protein ACREIF_03065 [Chthoniobacterales bacterium]
MAKIWKTTLKQIKRNINLAQSRKTAVNSHTDLNLRVRLEGRCDLERTMCRFSVAGRRLRELLVRRFATCEVGSTIPVS